MTNFETIHKVVVDTPGSDISWWNSYESHLLVDGLSETSRRVISEDCEYLVSKCLFPKNLVWPETRYRSGLVMGAVQSGKTASMLGVISKCVDRDVDVIVILAGTITNLWRQTLDRVLTQLPFDSKSILLPDPETFNGQSHGPLTNLYKLPTKPKIRKMLSNRQPIVFVVMKNGDHLYALSDELKKFLYPIFDEYEREFNMLVIDDEADDGSILDSLIEQNQDPVSAQLKQIPRHIVDLWSERHNSEITVNAKLFVNYMAYTATPQANFLQEDTNPLAPNAYVASLRTPFDSGELFPRAITYLEPNGYKNFYSGGEVFYSTFEKNKGLTITNDPDELEPKGHSGLCKCKRIQEATRCYLVSAAIRYLRSDPKKTLSSIVDMKFDSKEEVLSKSPFAHTMLIHPGAEVETHQNAYAQLLSWGGQVNPDDVKLAVNSGVRTLNIRAIEDDIDSSPELWTKWIESFEHTKDLINKRFQNHTESRQFSMKDWSEIKNFILNEIIPYVRISIINSDENSDDRPEFSPINIEDKWKIAPNLLTIFISGNVMSRGITLSGLATSLFMRHSNEPASDTQMQMQRWFGYRGNALDLTRVFMPEDQLSLFTQYHEADTFLRNQIINAMNSNQDVAPSPTILEGINFKATAKIAGVNKIALSPGKNPIVRVVNSLVEIDQNLAVGANLITEDFSYLSVGAKQYGVIRNTPISLIEAAKFLEQLNYSHYQPMPDLITSTRWHSITAQFPENTVKNHLAFPLFNPPKCTNETIQVSPKLCPYNIAAYLRLWDAATSHHLPGFVSTDNPDQPWRTVDLSLKDSQKPKFWVGIRFGNGPTYGKNIQVNGKGFPVDIPLMIRDTVHSGYINNAWGTRNQGEEGYRGDQYFDFHHHGELLDSSQTNSHATEPRPPGAPGLILLHIIHRQNASPVLGVGICIPQGGPDQIASRK